MGESPRRHGEHREKLNWNHEAHEEHEDKDRLGRMFHELMSRDHDDGRATG